MEAAAAVRAASVERQHGAMITFYTAFGILDLTLGDRYSLSGSARRG
jgi:hypothetical protein